MKLSYLVDTDWAIHFLNGHDRIVRQLLSFRSNGLGISIVTLAELYEGIHYSKDPAANERALQAFLTGVTILEVSDEICRIFGQERGRLRKKRTMIGDFDLLIGSTCLHHRLILLSNNRKHYERIKGLEIVSLL